MRSRILFGGVLLAATVACADSVTNPSLLTVEGTSRFEGEAPPPPIDSSMATYDGTSTTYIAVTYFYNKHGNNVWLSFDKTQAEGVTISPNARVTVTEGRAAARGTIALASDAGTWRADLSKAISPEALQRFGACKYTCASLSLSGEFTYRGGETEERTLSFQFRSAREEVIRGDYTKGG